MTVVIRLVMTDEMMAAFKEHMGVKPTRKAVVIHVNKLVESSLFPDGPPKKKKFKLSR
jgi:hypothetical protein